jgi:transcriptional regulator with XRE-family HTH domain
MLRKALDAATPSLREIAREAGVSYHAIRLYRAGIRTPKPKALQALIRALRKHTGQVAKAIDELERAAQTPTRTRRNP